MSCSARFELEGQFLGFEGLHQHEPKRILLRAGNEKHTLKLAKHLRGSLAQVLRPGAHLRITGRLKWDSDRHQFKKKAQTVQLLTNDGCKPCPRSIGSIQVCGKKNCWEHGGKNLWIALENALDRAGLRETVVLEKTGCLKNCRHCPSLLCSPCGEVCGRMRPENIPALLEEHFQICKSRA